MVGKSPELIVKISGDDKEFRRVANQLPQTASKGIKNLQGAAIGAGLAFAALAKGVADSVQEYRKFERDFSNVVTLLDKSSFKTKGFEQGLADIKSELIDLRATSGQSFEVLNKGLFDLVSAGIDAENSVKVLKEATDLALAGATDAGTAVDGLTAAINSYGFEADRSREIAEKFFTAQKFGKTTIAELAGDFGKVSAAASELGISFEELLASVSASTLASIRTNEAYTGLRAVISNIIKPTKDAAEEAERLGINFDTTALRARGFKGFLDEITGSANFNEQSLEKLFGSIEAVNVIMALTGSQADSFNKILNELNDTTQRAETFTEAVNTKNKTYDQTLARLEGTASSLRAEIGERLTPAFVEFAEAGIESLEILRLALTDLGAAAERLTGNLADLARGQVEAIAGLAGVDLVLSPTTLIEEGITRGDPSTALAEIKRMDAEKTRLAQEQAEREKKIAEERAYREQQLREEELEAAIELEEKQREIAEKKAEREQEQAERKLQREEEARQAQLEREDEQFEEDLERLEERLLQIDELESEFSGLKELREAQELQAKARTAKQKQAIDKATAQAGKKYADEQYKAVATSLEQILGTSTAVGKAVFLFNRGLAIADTIASTQDASMRAYASQLIPGDPSSLARAEAARIATIVRGTATAAVIAATSIQEVSGAIDGGIVQGGSFGQDSQPFMLAKDEIVIPSRLNPLSPNFEETFGGGLGIGGQSVRVEIGFEEEASRILTVKQREDSALGIQQ